MSSKGGEEDGGISGGRRCMRGISGGSRWEKGDISWDGTEEKEGGFPGVGWEKGGDVSGIEAEERGEISSGRVAEDVETFEEKEEGVNYFPVYFSYSLTIQC